MCFMLEKDQDYGKQLGQSPGGREFWQREFCAQRHPEPPASSRPSLLFQLLTSP
jgi:hypothetical protein